MRSISKFSVVAGTLALATSAVLANGAHAGEKGIWEGYYIGVNAGYSWGTADFASALTCPDNNCAFNIAELPGVFSTVPALGAGSDESNGFTGGVQVGLNAQSGTVVYGVEADFNGLDLGASHTDTGLLVMGLGQTATVASSVSADWLITVRARLGIAVTPTVLAYATAGAAVSDFDVATSYIDDGVGAPAAVAGAGSRSDLKLGYTVGGGIEWAVSKNWSLKGEYLYVDFGSVSTTAQVNVQQNPAFFGLTDNQLNTSADVTTHLGRVGLNYKF
ncbi:MAG: outer membrane beta-barrel protein [Hyphomicrobium sp.]|jgi:outer membrane immunogenic protein